MKTAVLLILSFILSINLPAQTIAPAPLTLNRTFLVNSAGLPEEFLLFAPDTAVQLLFNPARANTFSGNFIYVNYLSDFSGIKPFHEFYPAIYKRGYPDGKNPSISFASLFNTGSAKWLLEFTSGIMRNKDSYTDSELKQYQSNSPWRVENRNYSRTYNYSLNASVTTLKLSRIFRTNAADMSLGFFGIIYSNNMGNSNVDLQRYNFQDSHYNDTIQYHNANYLEFNTNYESEDMRYSIGLEFTAAGNKWDYIGSFDYQSSDNSISGHTYERDVYSDSFYNTLSNQWTENTLHIYRRANNTSDENPATINHYSYFRHSLDLITPEDNIFLALNAFYSFGDVSYYTFLRELYDTNMNGNLTSDTTSTVYSGKLKTDSWGVRLSAGYILNEKLMDIELLTGIKVSGLVSDLKYIDQIYVSIGNVPGAYKVKPRTAEFTIPVYLNYSPADWVSVYGGLTYSYLYATRKYGIDAEGMQLYNYTDIEAYIKSSEAGINQGWNSSKSIYFGCAFRHPSGLQLQFFFDKDISVLQYWNVSLGYHF